MRATPYPEIIYTSPYSPPTIPPVSLFHFHFPLPSHPACIPRYPASLPAYIDANTGAVITRGQLETDAKRLGFGLDAVRGDVALILSGNCLEYATVFFACQAAGLLTALANASYTDRELSLQIKDASPSLIFVQPELLPILRQAITLIPFLNPTIIIMGDTGIEEARSYRDYMVSPTVASAWEGERFENGEENATTLLTFSSGTTGLFKGVELTHVNLIALELITSIHVPITPVDSFLGILPFYHIYGLAVILCRSVHLGAPAVIMRKFEPIKFLESIEKYRITYCPMVPPTLLFLAKSPLIDDYDISSLKGVFVGAAPVPENLVRLVMRRCPGLLVGQGYGQTEMSPTMCTLSLTDAHTKIGSVGPLLPHISARLVDEFGRDVPVGQPGEVWVKGPTAMRGYWQNPKATESVFTEDGWLKTGDLARVDGDGYFYVIDRCKEMIKYNGNQVAPAELEDLLTSHPLVADSAVCGVMCEERATELPRAYIVVAGGLDSLKTEEERRAFVKDVEEFVNARVAYYKRLRGGYILIDAIPKSPSGKILRRKLRQMAVVEGSLGM